MTLTFLNKIICSRELSETLTFPAKEQKAVEHGFQNREGSSTAFVHLLTAANRTTTSSFICATMDNHKVAAPIQTWE